jgi:hypothetical protein
MSFASAAEESHEGSATRADRTRPEPRGDGAS